MFTGKIAVRRLRPRDVRLQVVIDINTLLAGQHSKSRIHDEESLRDCLGRADVVVVWNDDDRVVGMGVVVQVETLSHTFATVHNLTVRKGIDAFTICARILDTLVVGLEDVDFVDIEAWPEDRLMTGLLPQLGFVPRSRIRYRRKPPFRFTEQ